MVVREREVSMIMPRFLAYTRTWTEQGPETEDQFGRGDAGFSFGHAELQMSLRYPSDVK